MICHVSNFTLFIKKRPKQHRLTPKNLAIMEIGAEHLNILFHLDSLTFVGEAKAAGLRDTQAYFPYWPEYQPKYCLMDKDAQVTHPNPKFTFTVLRETAPLTIDISEHFGKRLAAYLAIDSKTRLVDDGHGFVKALYPEVQEWEFIPSPPVLERTSNHPSAREYESKPKVNFKWFMESYRGPRHIYFEPQNTASMQTHSAIQISPLFFLHKGKGFNIPILSTLDALVTSYQPRYVNINIYIDDQPTAKKEK